MDQEASLCSPNNKEARVEILATDRLVTRLRYGKPEKKRVGGGGGGGGGADLAILPHQIKEANRLRLLCQINT